MEVVEGSRAFLEVPINDKGFLISPPASPPVGWEPVLESAPVGHDETLVRELYGKLEAVQTQQIFQGEDSLPSIVVEDCDFRPTAAAVIDDDLLDGPVSKTTFKRTKRPPIAQSS